MTTSSDHTGPAWPASFHQGYARSIRGERLSYHSPEPGVNSSLLVRSLDERSDIAWETELLAETLDCERLSFLWLFGLDVTPDPQVFELSLNDHPLVSFANPVTAETRIWSVRGRDGAELTFRSTLVDKYEDLMGYAILSVPRSLVVPGRAQALRVVGETAGSRTWYMTFEARVEDGCLVRPLDLLVRRDGSLWHTVLFEFTRVGDAVPGTIAVPAVRAPGLTSRSFSLLPGHNAVAVDLPEVDRETEIVAEIRLGQDPAREQRFTLRPARRWSLSLVQHTHTDIGYTRAQAEILAAHLQFLDSALDLCDQTDDLPDEARFRWTCETSWAVREFLRVRPEEQVERFLRRVREGRIEVTALFLNLSDLLDEQGAAAQLAPLREFRDRGITVRAGMQSDINGVPWCLVDQLRVAGVDYLVMAQNTHRALKPFELPTLFRWESASGNTLLVHAGDHYMQGNTLGLLGSEPDSFRETLLRHLDRLAARGYSRDRLLVQFSGFFTDNSPPTAVACDVVRRWNEAYEWPRLRLDTVSGFLDEMTRAGVDDVPILRGAWPDWWMDGFGSAPRETGAARVCAGELLGVEGLLAIVRLHGGAVPDATLWRCEQVRENLLFYAEHTFGAAESIVDPTCANNMVQWGQKAAFVWKAVMECSLLREEALGRLDACVRRVEAGVRRVERADDSPLDHAGPQHMQAGVAFTGRRQADPVRQQRVPGIPETASVTVYNPLGWARSGPCEVYIDHRTLPRGSTGRLLDDGGRPVPMQAGESREDGTYWTVWASEVPALGHRTYRIASSSLVADRMARLSEETVFAAGAGRAARIVAGDFYEAEVDTVRGGIVRLLDRESGRNLVDADGPWTLGQIIHERLGNRHQIEAFRLDAVERNGWEGLAVEGADDGPVWRTLRLRARVPGCADSSGVTWEIRLYKAAKLVELRYAMRKLPVTDPEAVYVAFPFAPADATLAWESQGGVVRPGRDQLVGSASDWVGIQGFVAARASAGQTVLCSPEVPLVQLGGLNLGQFARVAAPERPHVFSWVLNNYWTTNFQASEGGELRWRYLLTSSADASDSFAARMGMEVRVPLAGRVRGPGS